VFVDFVKEGSPAQKAGVLKNDIVKKLDDQVLIDSKQLAVLVRLKKPGDQVSLTLLRKGKEQTMRVTLEEGDITSMDVRNTNTFRLRRWIDSRNSNMVPPGFVPPPSFNAIEGESFEIYSPQVNVTIDHSPGKAGMIVIKDPQGNLLFEGPLPIKDEIWTKRIPADVREKIQNMGINVVVPSTQPMMGIPPSSRPPGPEYIRQPALPTPSVTPTPAKP
jgi:hypothetical protein